MKVAVCKYPVDALRSFDEFAAKQGALLARARAAGAELAVLPEYLALELAATFPSEVSASLPASLAALQRYHDAWCALFAGLAREHRLYLNAGTFLLDSGQGRYRNRSYLFAPDGGRGWQDKLQLTSFEKRSELIDPGDSLKVFRTGEVRTAIAVCYDSEFPLPVRAQCEAGARLLLVPSCTDTAAGATRVQVGCLARALENRCFVAQAVTAGEAPWSPALDLNTGEATLYVPMDRGWPADGVIARTQGRQEWAVGELDFAALDATRTEAQVANDRDWPGQWRPSVRRAQVDALEAPESSAGTVRR